MRGIVVYKMTGSGNDFVFVDGRVVPPDQWPPERISKICRRGTGVGADGLVVLEPGAAPAAVRFSYFNSDGSRAPMCGNAALCATRMAAWLELAPADAMVLETDSGSLEARCLPGPGERAEIALPEATDIGRPDIECVSGERSIGFARVGVPHLVVVVDRLQSIALLDRGRELRGHRALGPDGANVNFVENSGGSWSMRTYERGVEAETLACGTGALAAAAVLCRQQSIGLPWQVKSASGAVLTIGAEVADRATLRHPRLAGEGRMVFRAILT
jgi:diaminopimelate epimerase